MVSVNCILFTFIDCFFLFCFFKNSKLFRIKNQQLVPNRGSAAYFACSPHFIVYKQDSYVGYILCQLESLNISIEPKLEVVITVDKQHQFISVYFEKR